MKFLTPASGRIALLAVLLTTTGCSTSPLDVLTALVTPEASPAAMAAAPITSVPLAPPTGFTAAAMHAGGSEDDEEPAFRPGNSEIAVAGEALAGAGDRIAMLPLPRPSGRTRKPEFAGGPVCGELAPGGRAVGMLDSGGLRFTIECFRAKAARPGPAVIILHGARGIGRNPIYERLAEQLVERGQSAFILQYLSGQDDPAATASAKAPAKPPAKTVAKVQAAKPAPTKVAAQRGKTQPRKHTVDAEGQTEAIETAITAVQALSYVNHERIGLFGLSLGGFHALAIAARDHRVGAVVDMFGAMPRPVGPTVERMPPTLVLHGERDAVVPVRRAHELAKLLKTVGAVHEVKIYKGQGHSFTGAADQDSVERTVAFLVRHLGEPTARDG
ncbi:MAG: dienelactone hydrolase family protein [Rhodospirillales bacterium]|nr:dienelactone hydrolase family protein [Rhodospirillales bacterium]